MRENNEIPAMLCEEDKRNPNLWRCWCPFCKTFHTHGAMPGHRVSHCHVGSSPFSRTGYYLRLKK